MGQRATTPVAFDKLCDSLEEMLQWISTGLKQLRNKIREDSYFTLILRLHKNNLRQGRVCQQLAGSHFEAFLLRTERL